MVGTERGNVYSCTRKAKTPADKLGQVYSEHIGPVYLLQRNPYLYKLFLTVGDYHANVGGDVDDDGDDHDDDDYVGGVDKGSALDSLALLSIFSKVHSGFVAHRGMTFKSSLMFCLFVCFSYIHSFNFCCRCVNSFNFCFSYV